LLRKIAIQITFFQIALFAEDPYAIVTNEVISLSVIALFLYVAVRLGSIFKKAGQKSRK